ncbi:MAG: LysE family translocator [Pseudomonadota bacterium]
MFDTAPALVLFAIASSITPGPNNIMLLASGANFGLRRTLPHMLGISSGHMIQVALVGLLLLSIFERYPLLQTLLLVPCAIYLLYLAWRVANAAPPGEAGATSQPLTALQAAAFQWVNPKAWYMAIYAQTNFAPDAPLLVSASLVAVSFGLVNLPSILVWAWGGVQARRLLQTRTRLRIFNVTMALCLVASLYPMIGTVLGES